MSIECYNTTIQHEFLFDATYQLYHFRIVTSLLPLRTIDSICRTMVRQTVRGTLMVTKQSVIGCRCPAEFYCICWYCMSCRRRRWKNKNYSKSDLGWTWIIYCFCPSCFQQKVRLSRTLVRHALIRVKTYGRSDCSKLRARNTVKCHSET